MDTGAKPIPGFEEFSRQVNSVFSASAESGEKVELQLVEATHLFSDERSQSFSLLFKAPLTTPARQCIFHLNHDNLGSLDLFLVPIRQSGESLLFEASFNLVR
jgi:hypothetical protein